jgi:hypothetical protein
MVNCDMARRSAISGVILAILLATAALGAAAVSRQQADSFAKKVAIINLRGAGKPLPATAARKTPVTETEINSWFAYRAGDLVPQGITQPAVTIIGNGKVMGVATLDLEAYAKSRQSGGGSSLWSLLGGRVPISVSGVLTTKAGKGSFNLQSASLSGIPLSPNVLQELVSYYSRTEDHPNGVRIDQPFALPAGIQQIEVGQGQAIVVQ